MTAKLWNCDGYWKPTVWNDKKTSFSNMIVCDGEWDGIEDAVDERIFYYTDGDGVLNDHGDFVIECVSEYTPDWWINKQSFKQGEKQ
jgi:hypothetical protein